MTGMSFLREIVGEEKFRETYTRLNALVFTNESDERMWDNLLPIAAFHGAPLTAHNVKDYRLEIGMQKRHLNQKPMAVEDETSNLTKHAQKELELIGAFNKEKDFYGGMTGNAVMELIKVFSKQGHSGMSASLVRGLFNKAAAFEPLSPLTGEDSEWNETSKGVFQNNRCGRVFKENGQAYDIDGTVFREPSGSCYTSRESRVNVTFPYTPKTEYVDVQEELELPLVTPAIDPDPFPDSSNSFTDRDILTSILTVLVEIRDTLKEKP